MEMISLVIQQIFFQYLGLSLCSDWDVNKFGHNNFCFKNLLVLTLTPTPFHLVIVLFHLGLMQFFPCSNDFKAALQGYTFKTVSELAGCKQIPRVVCATKAHQTGESKSSVHANEILVVRKVGRTTVMRKPVLKAFSVKNNEDKTLQV